MYLMHTIGHLMLAQKLGGGNKPLKGLLSQIYGMSFKGFIGNQCVLVYPNLGPFSLHGTEFLKSMAKWVSKRDN